MRDTPGSSRPGSIRGALRVNEDRLEPGRPAIAPGGVERLEPDILPRCQRCQRRRVGFLGSRPGHVDCKGIGIAESRTRNMHVHNSRRPCTAAATESSSDRWLAPPSVVQTGTRPTSRPTPHPISCGSPASRHSSSCSSPVDSDIRPQASSRPSAALLRRCSRRHAIRHAACSARR